MHVVIVTSCELGRECLMGVRPCQVQVQSACWPRHCCCQVCPFSVFSKMPYLLRFHLQFDSTNTTKLQDLDVWFFFLLSARPRAQEDSFKVEGHCGRRVEGTRGSTSSRKRIEETSISLRTTRLPLGSWLKLSVSFRAPLQRVERLKLGSCNCAIMASVECDLGRDQCLLSRYCLNHSAVPVDHHTRSRSVPRWWWVVWQYHKLTITRTSASILTKAWRGQTMSTKSSHRRCARRLVCYDTYACKGYYQTLLFEEFTLALFDPSSNCNTRVLSGVEVRSQSLWSCKNRSAAGIMLRFRV